MGKGVDDKLQVVTSFQFPPLGGAQQERVMAGRGYPPYRSNDLANKTPPYTLPGEGIAHSLAFTL